MSGSRAQRRINGFMRRGSARRISPRLCEASASTTSHQAPVTIISSSIGIDEIVWNPRYARLCQQHRRVTLLADARAAPQLEDDALPLGGGAERMRTEGLTAEPFQDRRRYASIRHRRFHVGLHLRRTAGVGGRFQIAPDPVDERVRHDGNGSILRAICIPEVRKGLLAREVRECAH